MVAENRLVERREKRIINLHFPERRTGFDRRQIQSGFSKILFFIRDNKYAIISLLVLLNLLNLADGLLTVVALKLGALEANPMLSQLFKVSPSAAITFKISIMLLVSLILLRFAKYRAAVKSLIFGVGIYSAVIIYHFIGLSFLT